MCNTFFRSLRRRCGHYYHRIVNGVDDRIRGGLKSGARSRSTARKNETRGGEVVKTYVVLRASRRGALTEPSKPITITFARRNDTRTNAVRPGTTITRGDAQQFHPRRVKGKSVV